MEGLAPRGEASRWGWMAERRPMIELQQTAAALYLAAGMGAVVGVTLPSRQASRYAVAGLALGAVVQGFAFATLHQLATVPSLRSLSLFGAFAVWVGIIFLLVLMRQVRLTGMTAVVGPVAFLVVFLASMGFGHSDAPEGRVEGIVPHAHVLLSSAGLSLLGGSGIAGLFFLVQYRRLKEKRPLAFLPSLEALDRVNRIALAVGFPLLTLGVITGPAWLYNVSGRLWSGTDHQTWTMVAWGIYAGLIFIRFALGQGARQAAASAVAGFAFLLFAVIGVGLLS